VTAPAAEPVVFEVDIDLIANRPPLNHNQRLTWRPKSNRTKLIRHTTGWRVKGLNLVPARFLTVQLHYRPGDNRRMRDPMNLTASSKPAIDGLVDAGLVPNDTDEFVHENTPVIHYGPGDRRLWITVEVTA
jgi:crossover junction endodeoxyribonuclease RusA